MNCVCMYVQPEQLGICDTHTTCMHVCTFVVFVDSFKTACLLNLLVPDFEVRISNNLI